jgi:hypothetical protein
VEVFADPHDAYAFSSISRNLSVAQGTRLMHRRAGGYAKRTRLVLLGAAP